MLKKTPSKIAFSTLASPVGKLTLVAEERALLAVLWENDSPNRVPLPARQRSKAHPILKRAEEQLEEFFAGERKKFALPLRFSGTPFQVAVWEALREIPYGKTLSYSTLAKRIGRANAHRAVGTANGRNPLSIVVPCHRVIAANGGLAGFAGGLEAKRFLLALETGGGK
jgi:methylated-DNA-[protein]-cysteine S-methyltransferase